MPIDGQGAWTVGRLGRAFDRRAVGEFLKALETDAVVVEVAPPDMKPLAEISRTMHANVVKIVRLILDKKLTRLAKLAGVRGISGLLFDPDEIWRLTHKTPVPAREAFVEA